MYIKIIITKKPNREIPITTLRNPRRTEVQRSKFSHNLVILRARVIVKMTLIHPKREKNRQRNPHHPKSATYDGNDRGGGMPTRPTFLVVSGSHHPPGMRFWETFYGNTL